MELPLAYLTDMTATAKPSHSSDSSFSSSQFGGMSALFVQFILDLKLSSRHYVQLQHRSVQQR
jgi:hypothetical protein